MNCFLFNFGLLVLRAGLGGAMIVHGAQKLKIIMGGGAANWLNPLGFGAAQSLYLAAFAELCCSAFVIAGFFTRLSSAVLAFTMFVAAFVFLHSAPWDKKELAFVFFIGFLALSLLGGGEFSLSRWLFGHSKIAGL